MKVYVDEMPKYCYECPCHKDENGECQISNDYTSEKRPFDCPLHSLADHDAELMKNAIVPKFNNKQFVYALYTDTDIIRGQIESFDYYSKSYLIFFGDDVGNDWIPEFLVFKTKKEAETKLKELQGE